ncbi:MAG: ATP-binding protein, partial [Nitrospinae bacterium]|nr:ATP-binding protein [Nitrospinota bacterium]
SQKEETGSADKMIDILLGTDFKGNAVKWQPSHPQRGLNNSHMVIVGSSGSGKTTTINSIVKSLKVATIPSILFDFKDDYVGKTFSDMSGAKVHDTIQGIPINPLDIPVDPGTEMAKVTTTVYEISGAIRKVFQLGVQQEANLKEALFKLYERYGINKGFQKLDEDQIFPTFDELYDVIDDIGDGKLLNRISPLFDLDMFKPSEEGLQSFLEGSVVIRFTQLPTDEVKKVGSELLLMGIYNFILRLGHSKKPRFSIIIDEAHKIANLKAIDTLMREARAYGVSVILSTQRASDLSAHVYSNAGSIIIMKLSESGDATAAAKIIGDQNTAKTLGDSIRSLGIGEAFLRNDHYNSPNVKLKIIHPDDF